MTDWKSYKGLGPWPFAKSFADNRYNVGNKIVDTTQPVWDINHTGIPISDRHDPCGVWVSRPQSTIPELNPIVPTIVSGIPAFLFIAWTPNYGGQYGRFVAIAQSGTGRSYYSDDGGYTWSHAPTSPSVTPYQFTYANGIFILTFRVGAGQWCSFTSEDGINYTSGTIIYTTYAYLYDVDYHPGSGLYAGFATVPADRARLYTSPDALVWTYVDDLALYATYYCTYHNGYIYALAFNYNYFHKYTMTAPYAQIDIPAEQSPFAYSIPNYIRREIKSNGTTIVTDQAYADGTLWYPHGISITRLDYSPQGIAFGGICTAPGIGLDKDIEISRDGRVWATATVPVTYPFRDVAVGNDRVLAISPGQVTIVPL